MAKRNVIYKISMEDIKKAAQQGGRDMANGFKRLGDYDYRRFFVRRMIIYALISLFCVAFLLLLSASTSPMYTQYCDGDSSIFMLIGKGIAMGKNVYTDYFDHKGPILFYLNALGYAMTGTKTGVFIVQCVFLSLTGIFMYKTARVFTKTVRAFLCVVISILAFASTISDGNLSEEYCMLFCMIPIYLSFKHYAVAPALPHPVKYMVCYGACFALCAFVRINNGVMIGGLVFTALITDFINGHIKNALRGIAFFFAGAAIVAVPICLFFIVKGTFGEMIFATFTFNFLYASEGSALKNADAVREVILWVLPPATLIPVSFIFAKRLGARVASLSAVLAVFALIPALMGFSYTHYYTTLIPVILIYCAVFFRIATQRITFLSLVLCVLMALPMYKYFAALPDNIETYVALSERQRNPAYYDNAYSELYYSAHDLASEIPEEDLGSVFGYDVSAAWFLEADIMPCYRLFTLQESWAEHYGEFGREINQMMLDTPPKWVIIHNIKIIESRQFLDIINRGYTLYREHGYDLLFLRND